MNFQVVTNFGEYSFRKEGTKMQSCRLLVIEDDSSLEGSFKKNLLERNYQIVSASSKEEALKHISLSLYSTVLWQISNLDGNEVSFLKEIKTIDEHIPVIILCDSIDRKLLVHFISMKTFAFMPKNPDHTELTEIIKAGLETFADGEEIKITSAKVDFMEIVIPARTNYIPRISNYLGHLFVMFSHRDMQRLLYAFRELLQNAMEHGSSYCPAKKVTIRYLQTQKFLLFSIEDEGSGFNISCLPHAAIGERKNSAMEVMQYRKQIGMRPGGLGIASAFSIADEILYNEKGNSVVMIKYF